MFSFDIAIRRCTQGNLFSLFFAALSKTTDQFRVVALFVIYEVLVVRNIEGLSGCVLWLPNVLFKWSFFLIHCWMKEQASKKLHIQLANALYSSHCLMHRIFFFFFKFYCWFGFSGTAKVL